LPNTNNTPTQRHDLASIGSASTVTKSDFEQFQNRLMKDISPNLKDCLSMASLTTDNVSHQYFLDELCTEREATAQPN
jgi:hypothetical protein